MKIKGKDITSIIEDLQFIRDDFIDDEDIEIFAEYLVNSEATLLEMANVRGKDCLIEKNLPFSFYLCAKGAVHGKHSIRLKVIWNPAKSPEKADGYLKLHGDYEYISGSHKYQPNAKELRVLRDFAKKYKVLFAAVWEGVLDADYVRDYFLKHISFNDLIDLFEVEQSMLYELQGCYTLEELEICVREYGMFNMND